MKPKTALAAFLAIVLIMAFAQSQFGDDHPDDSGVTQLCSDGTYPEAFCESRGN